MSALGDDAKALWGYLVSHANVADTVKVITAVTTGIHETATGKASNVLASISERSPDTLKLIEDITEQAAAFIGGPGAAFGVEMAIDLLAMSHTMTADEEKAWFDRQSSTEGQG